MRAPRRTRLSILVALIAGVASLPPREARAQCEEPLLGPQDVLPAVGAAGVTTDSWVRARYSNGYFGPEGPGEDPRSLFSLVRCGDCGASCEDAVPVRGEVEVHGDDLFFVPDGPLDAGSQYEGEALGLETSVRLRFCTTNRPDVAPPEFGREIRTSSEAVGPSCELPDGGFRVGIFAASATDDGPGGSIEYLLFLTRADGLTAPVLVDRVRNFAAGEITLRLFLDGAQAASPVCVQLGAIDGVGNVTIAGSEQCFDPVGEVAFQGCAAGRPGSRPLPLEVFGGVACLGLAWLARRRARARRGGNAS